VSIARYIFLDLETTGLDPERDVITQIAWRWRDEVTNSTMWRNFYVPFTGTCGVWAARHTLANHREPNVSSLDTALRSFMHTCLLLGVDGAKVYLVGANPTFDHSFLTRVMREPPYDYHLIDVEAMAMALGGAHHPPTLREIRKLLGFEGQPLCNHDAAMDAEEVQFVFEAMNRVRL